MDIYLKRYFIIFLIKYFTIKLNYNEIKLHYKRQYQERLILKCFEKKKFKSIFQN